MKNLVRISAGLLVIAVLIFLSNCKPKKTDRTDTSIAPTTVNCDSSIYDTLGDAYVISKIVPNPATKYHPVNPWKRNKLYTICIDAQLKPPYEMAEIVIYRKKAIFLKMNVLPGQQQFIYRHMKAGFSPEISLTYRDHNGNAHEVGIDGANTSACGSALTASDKLKSTSTETSTVLITIDEKD